MKRYVFYILLITAFTGCNTSSDIYNLNISDSNIADSIKTESGKVVEKRNYPVVKRENKRISITLSDNLVLVSSRTLQI